MLWMHKIYRKSNLLSASKKKSSQLLILELVLQSVNLQNSYKRKFTRGANLLIYRLKELKYKGIANI